MITLWSTIMGAISLAMASSKKKAADQRTNAWNSIRDIFYLVAALVLPYRQAGNVIPPHLPGHGGVWPMFIAPKESDSRSPCPALNAFSNHGILPRDGKNITTEMFVEAIVNAFNFSQTFAEQLSSAVYWFYNGRGHIDLNDLNAQNMGQHDASFTRPDFAFYHQQHIPNVALIDRFLSHAGNGVNLDLSDMAYTAGIRRRECKATNGQYGMDHDTSGKIFGSGNAAFMCIAFGGKVSDLDIFLKEDRFPTGWEPKCRQWFGYPKALALLQILAIELNINENQRLRKDDHYITNQATFGDDAVASTNTDTLVGSTNIKGSYGLGTTLTSRGRKNGAGLNPTAPTFIATDSTL